MKKLITICLLLATTFTASAQQKPTKEETVAFINRTTSQTIGTHYLYGKMSETKFTYDNYSFTQTGQAGMIF